MSGFAIKGWCPDAWRPMAAGDGLLVRVRPALGRMTRAQAIGLCAAAAAHGSGVIDVTRRANLQIRGVGADWRDLVARLVALDLVDRDSVREARRALVVAPDWRADDDSARIATALIARLDELPDLPGKVGFAIDAGPVPVLRDVPADFRIERSAEGALLLRAEGRASGCALVTGGEVDALIALAHWFVASGGNAQGRMARHAACLPNWATGTVTPAPGAIATQPGTHPLGAAYGLPFGQIDAGVLAGLVMPASVEAVRLTPWRVLIVEGAAPVAADGVLLDPADPLLRVDACPGAPFCPQASVETRGLARRLAAHVPGGLHVSGCAKGCARSRAADVTLTGRDGRFDLIRDGRAADPPTRSAVSPADIAALFGAA